MTRRSTITVAVTMALSLTAPLGSVPSSDEPVVVEVTAERFSFFPSEVRMALGQTVELRIRSEDTTHGFHLKGTEIDVLVPKRGRGTAVVRFTPDRPGRYEFECSKLCGAGHHFMRGEIIVDEAADAGAPR